MRIAIMQPYFFPYIGYFQLIRAVDQFVILDNVTFIKGGWINRNYINDRGSRARITLEVIGASSNVIIKRVKVGKNREKLFKTISQTYARAPYFSSAIALVEESLLHEDDNLAMYLGNSLQRICRYLGISPQWLYASELEIDALYRGQERVLEICRQLGATSYLNLPGGKELYERQKFKNAQIELQFIEPRTVKYNQSCGEFVPNLSILDVIMFNSRQECRVLLDEYSIE